MMNVHTAKKLDSISSGTVNKFKSKINHLPPDSKATTELNPEYSSHSSSSNSFMSLDFLEPNTEI